MNRPRHHDKHLPRGVYFRHGAYYHVRGGKWTRIGKGLREALSTYAAILETPSGGMADLIDQAMPHIVQRVSTNTEKQYLRAVAEGPSFGQSNRQTEKKP